MSGACSIGSAGSVLTGGEVPWNCPLITCGPAVPGDATDMLLPVEPPALLARDPVGPGRILPGRLRIGAACNGDHDRCEHDGKCSDHDRPAPDELPHHRTPPIGCLVRARFDRAIRQWKHRARIRFHISSLIDESISAAWLGKGHCGSAQGFPGTMANLLMRVDDPLSPGAEPSPHQAHETSHAGGGRPAAA